MEDITKYTKKHRICDINPDEALEFAKKWGRGIDDETNQKFVTMYVNERTIDYKKKEGFNQEVYLRRAKLD